MSSNEPGRRMQRREQRKREREAEAQEPGARRAEAQPAAAQRRTGRRQPGTGSLRARRKPGWRRTLDSFGGPMVVGAIALALVVVAGLIWLSGTGGDATGGGDFEPQERSQVSGRIVGDPNAPVRVIEFSDFQCPHCANFARTTAHEVESEFVEPGTAAVEFHHYAFLGEESIRAAEAAECANDQGRFWDYHDILFLRQAATPNSGAFSDSNLRSFAREIGEHFADFDTAAFDACLASGEKRAVVADQTTAAQEFGVRSTPSFLVDTTLVEGNQPIEVWRDVMAEVTGEGAGAPAGTPQGWRCARAGSG